MEQLDFLQTYKKAYLRVLGVVLGDDEIRYKGNYIEHWETQGKCLCVVG